MGHNLFLTAATADRSDGSVLIVPGGDGRVSAVATQLVAFVNV